MTVSAFAFDVLTTVAGGIILALLFFLSREKFFPLPNITGHWHLELNVINTAYNPYKGMVLRYTAILFREGNRVHGTLEKVYERSSTGEREFIGKNRTRAIADGCITKNYFSKDTLTLHVVEDGHGRESTTYFDVSILSAASMSGTFSTMVANQDGTVKWQRSTF